MFNSIFMDRIRSFFGLQSEPPRNDFRNPIWGSDDEDDGDELYTRQRVDIYKESIDLQQEFAKNVHEIFSNLGIFFDDMKFYFDKGDWNESRDIPTEFPDFQTETFDSNRIRNQYLKPGYDDSKPMQDEDLDGKISSQDISGLLNQEENRPIVRSFQFNDQIIPEGSFSTTIITTKVTRPDGTVETRRTVKAGNEIIEDKTITEKQNGGNYSLFTDPFKIKYPFSL